MDMNSLASRALAATLDRLAIGVIVVTGEHRILYANQEAVQMFARGFPVRSVKGQLITRETTANARLARAIAMVGRIESEVGDTGVGVSLGGATGGRAIAHVVPLPGVAPEESALPQVAAAVFVVQAEVRPSISLAPIVDCFGLTPAEAHLVERLAGGVTLVNAAAALGIAETTAKSHLAHVFSKAGVSRQVELMALIHRLAPPVQRTLAH